MICRADTSMSQCIPLCATLKVREFVIEL